jgi:uncharacterized protein
MKTSHTPGAFCWFELATTDPDAAKAFYSSIFGWTASDNPMGPGEVYTIFQIDGKDAAAAYGMRPDQRAQGVPPHWLSYVCVKSADDTAARARQLGGTVLAAPFDVMTNGRMSVIQDPTGATFSIWQPARHSGTGITLVHGTAAWVDLSTPDQVTGARFYGDLFGWRMAEGESMRPAAPGTYFHIVKGDTMIGGIPPSEHRHPDTPAHWMIYFQVDNCEATVAKATSIGGTVLMPPMEMEGVRKFAVLADPQGARFALVQLLSMAAHEAPPRPAAKAAPKPVRKAVAKAAPKPTRKAVAKAALKPARRPVAKAASKRKATTTRKALAARKGRTTKVVRAAQKTRARKRTRAAPKPTRKPMGKAARTRRSLRKTKAPARARRPVRKAGRKK